MGLLAKRLESYPPDKFSKALAVALVQETAKAFVEDDPDTEESYRQQLRFCAEHGLICLEYYRRHGVSKRQRIGKAVQG